MLEVLRVGHKASVILCGSSLYPVGFLIKIDKYFTLACDLNSLMNQSLMNHSLFSLVFHSSSPEEKISIMTFLGHVRTYRYS